MYNLMGNCRFRKNVANYDRWPGYRVGQLYSFHCIGLCAYTAKHSRRQTSSSWLSTYRRTKIWTSIKQTTRRLQSWGRKMPFIGIISRSEEDIFYDSLSLFFVVYIFSSFPSSIIVFILFSLITYLLSKGQLYGVSSQIVPHSLSFLEQQKPQGSGALVCTTPIWLSTVVESDSKIESPKAQVRNFSVINQNNC
jgi:hypothetical protein